MLGDGGVRTRHRDADEPFKSPMELLLYQLPLLWVEMEHLDGSVSSGLAFNDAWVERATGQTAWLSTWSATLPSQSRLIPPRP